jgi:hypothetical protein
MQYVYFNNKNWVNPNKDAGGDLVAVWRFLNNYGKQSLKIIW